MDVGIKFISARDGRITAIRLYRSTQQTQAYVATVWGPSGEVLGRVNFSKSSTNGWQTVNLAEPIAIKKETTYTVSYSAAGSSIKLDYGMLGVKFEPSIAATPSPTRPPSVSPSPTRPPSVSPSPTRPPSSGGFPSVDSTGPRVSVAQMSTHTGNLSTSADGQVIERMVINGNLTIRHNNVIVRDVLIRGVGRYMVHVDNVDARCPSNVKVEYTEVDGSRVGPNQIPVYAECGATFDHLYVHGSGRGIRLVSNSVVSNSFVIAHRHEGDMHRTAIGHNGGSNNTVYHNTLYCEGTNCSSAVSSYGDFAQVDGFRLENNLLATTAYYCVYGGSGVPGGSNAFPHGSNVKIINNHFSTIYASGCGRSAPIHPSSFANGVRGNECHGNVWHESRMSADTACNRRQ